jgi:hypothetical protein
VCSANTPVHDRHPTVTITIERHWDRCTFPVNGRDDLVVDLVWGVTTYETENAAVGAAQLAVRALQRARAGPAAAN